VSFAVACYMRETFVQLDGNRISIRLSNNRSTELRRSAFVQHYLLRVEQLQLLRLSGLSICVPSSA
jgi:hypothetical protein